MVGAGLNIDLLVRVETETGFFAVVVTGVDVGVAVDVAIGVGTPLLQAFSHRVAVARIRIWCKLHMKVLRHNCSVKI